ncbi:hypothetical protein MMC14_005185 [Varicellaria rhodocarpa]|nr:hypothetical protein [Varicellaria rhodocarpa]
MDNILPLSIPQRLPLQIPLQQSVSSASSMPLSPRGSFSSNTSIVKYAESYRLLMEHQRQVHEEERSLWQIERQELQARVAELESTLRKCQISHLSNVSSPTAISSQIGTTFIDVTNKSSRSMSESTGDEYWRGAGGKSNAQPTRTFSDPEIIPTKIPERWMPSIAEDESTDNTKVTKDRQQKLRHKPSIDGVKIDKNLDGIIFKPGGLPPEIVKNIMTPQSLSPSDVDSPNRVSPGRIELPSENKLTADDLYTKYAGHTPLARMDHNIGSQTVSDVPTPTQVEREQPPLEPRPSFVRPPNERADSYFPAIPESIDEDPELEGPLGLQNDKAADANFLEELDCKLEKVASEPRELAEPSPPSSTAKLEKTKDDKDSDTSFDQGEPEPKLRIKRSMNFGSRFGSSHVGRIFD